ncbi:hypothetical protein [Streptomyces marianii]|uniref:Uncharacterized protein n=1 Tax=Streptomyces marianii TaxID=1817406 RepID=A0A5R9DX65_9ACTN|nr:hypothetical protein [Streptomyces marianii]TLQ39452.1 hypothetical protein FEF34_39480 [Streptomyces marianii]
MLRTAHHHIVPTWGRSADFVLAYADDGALRIWTRGAVEPVGENFPPRDGGALLIGGTITDRDLLLEIVEDFLDQETTSCLPVKPGRVRGVRPMPSRVDTHPKGGRRFFTHHAISPLHTYGPWPGAAPEIVFTRPSRLPAAARHEGFFATGLPELPADMDPADALLQPTAAVLTREQAECLTAYLRKTAP